jgi:hypothetical protein
MRQKKIRGHNRRHKQIENWRLNNISLDLVGYLSNEYDRYYTKIDVHPWRGISITNSEIPQPSGKTKQKMLDALLDIYENWKAQLDKLGKPYYLKVWLFEPRFSQSQVVVALGDNIDFYENTFFKPEDGISFKAKNYGHLKSKLSQLTWDYCLDEDHYSNTEVGNPESYASRQDYEDTLKWFRNLLKKPHRTHRFNEPVGEMTELYSFKRGEVWLGGKQ